MRHLILTVVAALAGASCEKYELDRQMETLCKKDGGVKVYETVKLPPEMFDKDGDPFPGWAVRPPEQRLGAGYQLLHELRYLKQGDPVVGEGQLFRSHWIVVRIADQKSLGEAIVYGRSGGDFIALGHFSSRTCPERLGVPGTLIQSIFINQG